MRGAVGKPHVRVAKVLAALLALLCVAAPGALAAPSPSPAPPVDEVQGTRALLETLAADYKTANPTHETVGATRVRAIARALQRQLTTWQAGDASQRFAAGASVARELSDTLGATRERLQPWPPPLTVNALLSRLRAELQYAGVAIADGAPLAKPYKSIDVLLGDARAAARGARSSQAAAFATEAYALFAAGPGKRLSARDGGVAAAVDDAFWRDDAREPGLIVALDGTRGGAVGASADSTASADGSARADERAAASVGTAATVLGDHTIGKDTVVADAAVIVFREGLEAVLILAAITASFVGERRRLRRPVLLGALLGLVATAVTYLLAQALVDALGDGGLRLQAITGLIAIAVLLLVTNWFFHRVYWSEWIGRFHKRRRALERIDRLGFVSGQLVGFVLLGLTSVYREGFETVLFLQNLQVSAGSQATVLGVLIGLAGTLAVGFVTFKLERKLPYKKMLIATGVLIGLVLGVMVGTTVHTLQDLGWVPSTPTGFVLAPWWGQWLGAYATWQGIGAQLAALLVVYGSYTLARQLQQRRYRRAPREVATLAHG